MDKLSFNTSSSGEQSDSVACAKAHKAHHIPLLAKGLPFPYEGKNSPHVPTERTIKKVLSI